MNHTFWIYSFLSMSHAAAPATLRSHGHVYDRAACILAAPEKLHQHGHTYQRTRPASEAPVVLHQHGYVYERDPEALSKDAPETIHQHGYIYNRGLTIKFVDRLEAMSKRLKSEASERRRAERLERQRRRAEPAPCSLM